MLIGVRMLNFVQEQLRLPLEKKLLWTENQCVLHWITSKKPLTTLAQNRVKEITETKDMSFRYVVTSQNPADLATRGISARDLDKCELWWHGPKWLHWLQNDLLKRHWRRLKVKQRARKPCMKPPT